MASFETPLEQQGSCNAPMGARAVFNNGRSSIARHVRSFSITGARLALKGSVNLPDEFMLEIPGRQKAYRAGLRWKSRDSAGVKFLSETAIQADGISADEDATVEGVQLELERFRREIKELKAKLASLGCPPTYSN